jgi:hypothetical protein
MLAPLYGVLALRELPPLMHRLLLARWQEHDPCIRALPLYGSHSSSLAAVVSLVMNSPFSSQQALLHRLLLLPVP